jgi:RNA polymerase sigma-70 factor, ECF subfamily
MVGAAAVARALAVFYGQAVELRVAIEPVRVNGQPGFISRDADGRLVNVLGLDVAGGRVTGLYSILNPDKLSHLGPLSPLGLRPRARAAAQGAERAPRPGS